MLQEGKQSGFNNQNKKSTIQAEYWELTPWHR